MNSGKKKFQIDLILQKKSVRLSGLSSVPVCIWACGQDGGDEQWERLIKRLRSE